MEVLFLTTVLWLAADILFASFNGSWYYVVGPVLARRGGRIGDLAPEPPAPERMEKLTSSPSDEGDPRVLLFVRRSDAVYTFQRNRRRGASLLLGSIRFDRDRGKYEVRGRVGLFFLIFLISLTALFILSHGYEQLGGRIFAGAGLLFLVAFAIQDWRTCRKVAEAVDLAWR